VGLCFLVIFTSLAWSQQGADISSASAEQSQTVPDSPTLLPHFATERLWISAQENIIFQYHPAFPAAYSGANSLHAHAENATSNIGTLYLGFSPRRHTELLLDIESAAGGGISDALGLAGFTNVDVVRNPELGVAPYVSRVMIRQIVPLSKEEAEIDRGPLSLEGHLPVRRLEFRAGKFGMNDFFDVSGPGSDSHFQFMNWTIDNNGAYDYAADTRGYTYGIMAEYYDRAWSFRFAEALMPKVANGIDMVWNLRRARSENYELELRPSLIKGSASILRLLVYENHANMGVYRDAILNYLAGKTPTPEITAHSPRTTVKYGFGINLEQQATSNLRAFARWGWNEGQHESYCYTEVDEAFEIGADLRGQRWRRKLDKAGAAFFSNGISAPHQQYLALGGKGFLLGDGTLSYGRENILEAYYNAHIWRGVYTGLDLQHINNPGYNHARGPVIVPGIRLHFEF
jgi:high affinity Mn2+ porin